MFEKDYEIINDYFRNINNFSFNEGGNCREQVFRNIENSQRRCKHMYPNMTDAIYYVGHNKSKCAICGKEF